MLFPDSICCWTSAEYQVVNISPLYKGHVDGKLEDCTEVPTNSGQKQYAQGGKKEKDFHLPCTKKKTLHLLNPSCYLTPQRKGYITLDCCSASAGSRPYSWAIWVFSFRFDGSINLWLQRCAVSGLLSYRACFSLSNPPFCFALM